MSQLATFRWIPKPEPERMPSGIAGLEFPRGGITEICGRASSGRTSLAMMALAQATAAREICAWIDADDAFSPHAAENAGVVLRQVLWVRCGHNPAHALKTADLLVQAGGFGVIVLDIADVKPEVARRIPLPSWFRLQRALEPTRTVMLLLEQQPNARTAAASILEMRTAGAAWSTYLHGAACEAVPRKPVHARGVRFDARSLAG
jgi:hypothetical protein